MIRVLKNVLLVVCLISFTARAEEATKTGEQNVPHKHRAMERTEMANKLVEELNLTDEQKSKIQEIIKAEQPTLNSLRTNMFNARQEIVKTMQNSNFDEAKLKEAWNKFSSSAEQFLISWGRVFNKIRPLLTEEQKEKLNEKSRQITGITGGGIGHMPPCMRGKECEKDSKGAAKFREGEMGQEHNNCPSDCNLEKSKHKDE
jgi:Spy/CpxP family protein refolding chaperone